MRAAQLYSYGDPARIDEVEMPRRASGESLIEIEAAAVGHIDLTIASGRFSVRPALPHICGTDGVGRIVESDRFPVGTRVLVRGDGVGVDRPGCWAEYVCAPDTALTVLSDRLPAPVAATFLSPTTSGYIAVESVARVSAGERVLVTGASGAVGAVAAQFALRAGADVTGLVSSTAKARSLARGVEPLLATDDVVERLAAEQPFDVLIDTVGGHQLARLLGRVAPGGRAVAVGYTRGESVTVDLPAFLFDDVSLLPLNMLRRRDEQMSLIPMMSDLIESGDLELTVQEFALAELPGAVEALDSGQVIGRAVVIP
ncbi:quinone oxidoreductase family protein [Prescottella equi]|uniref:quinone oxidoreductase family protein n=1 Tax=Rhodococcus hoagii TaxID=43767 RepID=UPI00301C9241